MSQTLAELINVIPQRGIVDWIGVRPARSAPMQAEAQVLAQMGKGLDGDRLRPAAPGARSRSFKGNT